MLKLNCYKARFSTLNMQNEIIPTNLVGNCKCQTWNGKPYTVDMEIAVDSGFLRDTNLEDSCGSCGGYRLIK